ncbi:PilN domain-containing protein [Hoeflea marina]|nr:PilN domain-containing protein [Hoeflea marina]
MKSVLIDMWNWWATTLASCRPGRFNVTKPGSHIAIDDAGVTLVAGNGAILARCADGRLAEFARDAARAAGRKPLPVSIGENRYVERNLTRVPLRETHSRDMILLDVAGSIPFNVEDIHVLRGQARGFRASGVTYQILRRSVLAPILKALDEAGLRVGEIRLQRESGFWAVRPQAIGRGRRTAFSGPFQLLGTGLVIAACLATFVHLHVRNATALGALEARVDALGVEAAAVRALLAQRKQAVDRLTAIHVFRNSNPAIVSVWEQLTQVIPDSAYLTDLEVSQSDVRLTGFADSAAELLPALEAAPMFENVEFTAPVVNVPGRDREHFSMMLRVAR